MANSMTPIDVYKIMNDINEQTLGKSDIKVVDTTTFTTVGEKLLRTGTENVMNAISYVVGRTIFSSRPYRRKLRILETDQQRYGAQTRKISYLYSGAEPSQDANTDLNPDQLADGQSIDMYKINNPKAVQLNFYGTKKLQKHITRHRDALAQAFESEAQFAEFIRGVMVEFNNEVEIINENRSRLTLLNFMAGISSMGLTEVDLTAEYNRKFGTSYTRAQLLSTHLTSFMQFMVATVQDYSNMLTDIGFLHHANLGENAMIPRHTPKNRQRMIMYGPYFTSARAMVFSDIFNPDYLQIGDFEAVNYWQSQTDREQINVKPNILNVSTGSSENAATPVQLAHVIGLLYDEEALGVVPQFDYASTTPFNSAGGYFNTFLHWRFNTYNDFTENAVLFVMGEGGAGDAGRAAVTASQLNLAYEPGIGILKEGEKLEREEVAIAAKAKSKRS